MHLRPGDIPLPYDMCITEVQACWSRIFPSNILTGCCSAHGPWRNGIGETTMLKKYNQHKYGSPEYEGPYAITTVNDNGTVRIQRRKLHDVINIRNIKPYYQWIVRTLIMGASAINAVMIAYQYVDWISLTSAIIPFKVSLRFSPRSIRDQGFLNTRVMSWMTSRVKLSDDIDHASTMSRMTSQQLLSDDIVSRFNIKSRVLEMWLQGCMTE